MFVGVVVVVVVVVVVMLDVIDVGRSCGHFPVIWVELVDRFAPWSLRRCL